ncbi:glycosyltransferase [Acuticoccus sp. MNP-M23]|uniref:glycosyltransferase n=1 Tax=Acuticoccus sp. MNP-M23 TaxID=3072793 RepID=UPI002814F3AF|nr:glycosyltransferase [Acuticoccus sp. MNP-M23]WMS42165.1 glycosyltransferase [Acuticoccus sp. MNP-M23]
MQRRYLPSFGSQRGGQSAEPAEPAEPAAPSVEAPVSEAAPAFAAVCYVDRFSRGDIAGWATAIDDPEHPLTIHFHVEGVLVGIARADMVRADVASAGKGPKHCGFQWRIPGPVAESVLRSGSAIDVSGINASGASVHFTQLHLHDDPSISDAARALLRPLIEQAIVNSSVSALDAGGPDVVHHDPARYPLHERMFSSEGSSSGSVSHSLSPYTEFTHRRLNRAPHNPLDGSEAAKNNYLRWYLDEYGNARKPRRAPLGADEISYLNASVPLVGVPFKASRISLSYAMTDPQAAKLFPIHDLDRYEAFVAWWSCVKAPALNFEDCLVPDYYVEVLRRMAPNWMGTSFALSQMMMRIYHEEGANGALDINQEADRVLFHVWYLLHAIGEPGLVRFVPTRNLSALLEGAPGHTLFDRIIQSIYGNAAELASIFNAETYADLLWRKGFDITRRRFIFRDVRGNRFEAARFPPATMPWDERIRLQVIGPLHKSSGLGQATRLSAETIQRTGIEAAFVDFGLDNPAPVGMTTNRVTGSEAQPAQVNLIHLNGETVPIALAYMPDVFTGAYNIGYFFWELSTPAASQHLALDLLDEIWVATDYGVEIYRTEGGKPVRNVGMAFDPVPEPSREEARAYAEHRLPIGPDTFVYLAAFDSFSFLERKNPHGVVEAFREAFDPGDDVLLVLKTHNRDFVLDAHQTMRWDRIVEIASTDPRIVILNETLKFEDLIKLKKGCDCYVSLHRSEGWGFGMIEAMSIGVPVVTTGYSGNLDFTRPDNAWLVDYDLIEPQNNEYLFVERGQVWGAPKLESAVEQLRAVRSEKAAREAKVEAARSFVHENFSLDAQARKYRARLDEIFAMLDARGK